MATRYSGRSARLMHRRCELHQPYEGITGRSARTGPFVEGDTEVIATPEVDDGFHCLCGGWDQARAVSGIIALSIHTRDLVAPVGRIGGSQHNSQGRLH